MSARVLLDTNVLVYADDSKSGNKRTAAREVVRTVRGCGALTAQVLGEYFVTVTRKLAYPLEPGLAAERIARLVALMPVLPTTEHVVAEAVRGVRRYDLHYYDAQIWATARLSGIAVIVSEDFNTRAEIEGVRFVNPFEPGFAFETLVSE